MNSQTGQPEILEVEWDYQQVDRLFNDLEQGAEIQHVQVRSTADGRPSDRTVTLREAHQSFKQGDARAIQIHYAFDGQSWCDTLMIGPELVRIIRTINVG